jgi:hypothetical protein
VFSHNRPADFWVTKVAGSILSDRIRQPDRFCSMQFDTSCDSGGLFCDMLELIPRRIDDVSLKRDFLYVLGRALVFIQVPTAMITISFPARPVPQPRVLRPRSAGASAGRSQSHGVLPGRRRRGRWQAWGVWASAVAEHEPSSESVARPVGFCYFEVRASSNLFARAETDL